MFDDITCSLAETESDFEEVFRLRQKVYAAEHNRIISMESFKNAFDNFTKTSHYILARKASEVCGTVKLIIDSREGLPCETVTDITSVRRDAALLAEIGHLITLADVRRQNVVFALIGAAIAYASNNYGVTHILGDIFFDKKNKNFKSNFYHRIGCREFYGPYKDNRFNDAPESLIILLKIEDFYQSRISKRLVKGRLFNSKVDNKK